VVADWRGEADDWWAEVLRLPADAMRIGGAFALDHVDHAGVVAVKHAAAPVVYGPPGVLTVLQAAAGRLATDDLLQGQHLAAMLGRQAGWVLGPAWYGYATAGTLAPAHGLEVRALGEQDLPRLARLHAQTPAAERDESGTTGLPAFGYLDGPDLLAVACLGIWHDMPTVGVLTHPQARGRGLARMVVTAAARQGLTHRAIVQYRAWRRNTPSIAVATRCGFSHYCDGLVIDLIP
jgi:GNAT superfamily N-acetyltransferase